MPSITTAFLHHAHPRTFCSSSSLLRATFSGSLPRTTGKTQQITRPFNTVPPFDCAASVQSNSWAVQARQANAQQTWTTSSKAAVAMILAASAGATLEVIYRTWRTRYERPAMQSIEVQKLRRDPYALRLAWGTNLRCLVFPRNSKCSSCQSALTESTVLQKHSQRNSFNRVEGQDPFAFRINWGTYLAGFIFPLNQSSSTYQCLSADSTEAQLHRQSGRFGHVAAQDPFAFRLEWGTYLVSLMFPHQRGL